MRNDSSVRTDDEVSEIYKRNVETIYRLCVLYLRNIADAEDAVQSVFVRLMKSDKAFTDHEHEKAWLIVTAKNYCKDMLKSWWRFRRVRIVPLPEISHWDDSTKGSEIMEQLLSLPSKYREVLYLYYYEGYSVKEIGRMLNRKESTVQTQLYSGRKRLKENLEGGVHVVRPD
ncbi:RNA polymerase sigma factor [Paenibacillus sp. MMS18-CY102]|uniref:RNA polymerase sigma factor n=1 Tax=Paenibacillus sp. MMS18-CY102 TaxID=2682849 RepID=UPI00136612CA|nr:RNA polymerase sigma factor [Paenibacillus sp. MMS18-CY102]MWC28621.1 sigma-70 family RNA polymerase sigma factor [Paenibacillus sp. MMS18-CY102]